MNSEQLRAATFIRHVEIHDELTSTNDRALQLARETGVELPALVVARRQTAGRGRGKNTWWSADGALTFSILLEPASLGITATSWPQLSLATAVAVCEALQQLLPTVQRAGASPPPAAPRIGIKWPNDILIDGRKICGILIESPSGAAPAKDRLVIGIGINVNNSPRDMPDHTGPNATSLCELTAATRELQTVLVDVLKAICLHIDQLRARDPALARAWQQLNLLAGENVEFSTDSRSINGRCIEIADDGALILDTTRGRERLYGGSVRFA